MPTSTIAILGDAIAAQLNAAYAGQFIAARRYVPNVDVLNLGTVDVQVVPAKSELEQVARGQREKSPVIQIGVRKKVASDNPADCDPVAALAESIADSFSPRANRNHWILLVSHRARPHLQRRNDPEFTGVRFDCDAHLHGFRCPFIKIHRSNNAPAWTKRKTVSIVFWLASGMDRRGTGWNARGD